jgi:uncharacterized Zn-binding protein involved in type VI secretion
LISRPFNRFTRLGYAWFKPQHPKVAPTFLEPQGLAASELVGQSVACSSINKRFAHVHKTQEAVSLDGTQAARDGQLQKIKHTIQD